MYNFLIRIFVRNSENTKDRKVRQSYGYLGGFVGIAANVLLFAVKLLTGLLINSIAVMADSFNNLSDAASSIITLIGFKITNKPADREHPFGHGRIEYISALIVSFMVILVGFEFIKSSVDRIMKPETVEADTLTIAVLLLSIILKLWLSGFNKKIGKTIGSKAMEASAWDSISDVITTSVVLISIVLSGWIAFPIDGYIGVIVALFIIYSGISITKETLNPLLGEAPEHEFVEEIIRRTLTYEGIIGVHDVIVHNYGPSNTVVSLHAELPSCMDIMKAHDIIDDAEKEISEAMNIHLVIHMDPINTNDEVVQQTQQEVMDIIAEFSMELSIHDFRVVGNGQHKNLIFDMVVPPEVHERDEKQLVQYIRSTIKSRHPGYDVVITIDRNYAILR
ncbi:MAG: cation diffusion facilitator family transporter [Bacillota bacterium]